MEPEWSSVVAQKEDVLLSIDCTLEAQLCDDFNVISYPAVRYFDGRGVMAPYRGPRKAHS